MKRWGWGVLLLVAAMAALTVGAAAAEVTVNGIRYDPDTGTVLGPVDSKTITRADIQAVVNNVEITRINQTAFRNASRLNSVTVPRTITAIGASAFTGCTSLKTVELPDGLTEIPDAAFYNCTQLGSISIPSSVTKIGKNAFLSSGLSRVTFPAAIKTVGESAFEGCASLAEVVFQDNVSGDEINATITPVTEIGPRAFSSCKKLSKLTLSASVQRIDDSAFSSCEALTKAVIRGGTNHIGIGAFSGCPLTDVVIFGSSVTIGADAFQGAAKTAVIHYAGTAAFPQDALPEDGTLDMVHSITPGQPSIRASISCTDSGSVQESLSCDKADCRYRYNEPVRTVPPLPHDLEVRTARKAPTCTEAGQLEQKGCKNCNYMERAISTPPLGHDPQPVTDPNASENNVVTQPATCQAEGVLTKITKRCSRCSEPLESTTEAISKIAHTYDSVDHIMVPSTCERAGVKVIDRVCSECGYRDDPTAGCEDCREYQDKETPTDEETEKYIEHVKTAHSGIELAKGTHSYEPTEVRTEPGCETDGKIERKSICRHCGQEEPGGKTELIETILAKGHTPKDLELDPDKSTAGDCLTDTVNVYKETVCTVCGKPCTPDTVTITAPGSHTYKDVEEKIIKEATCKETGLKEVGARECTVCGDKIPPTTEIIPKTAHTWGTPESTSVDEDGNPVEDKDPTCGDEGAAYVIVVCSVCGETEHRKIELPATGKHNYEGSEWTTVKNPTATEDGLRERPCMNPGCTHKDSQIIPATGEPSDPGDPNKPTDPEKPKTYSITLVQGAGGTTSVSRSTAKAGDLVTVTVSPSSGYVLDMIRVIGGSQLVSLTNLGNNQYRFTMPSANVEVRATYDRTGSDYSGNWTNGFGNSGSGDRSDPRRTTDVMPVQIQEPSVGPAGASERLFQDIPTDHWAAGEINWASQMGYMNGTGNRFNPDGAISQQQMWMVLARLTGNQPANMAEARRWAELGGYADGSSPTGPVKRHQLVTALYRCARLSGRAGRTTTSLAGYPDSRTVPAVAREAFTWALSTGVVSGDAEGRLKPNDSITRAQFAVILYRYSTRT